MKQSVNILLSGGGTGGHIYPAIAIANELKQRNPSANFLFVGAKDRMEMEKVPQAGYKIKGLNISGLQRRLTLKNLAFPFKLIQSLVQASRIIKNFNPNIVIGTGGFASGPTLYMAAKKNIPSVIQEQNSYPGITNKILAKKAEKEGFIEVQPPIVVNEASGYAVLLNMSILHGPTLTSTNCSRDWTNFTLMWVSR